MSTPEDPAKNNPEHGPEKDGMEEIQTDLRKALGDKFSPVSGRGGGGVNSSDFYMRAVLGFPWRI